MNARSSVSPRPWYREPWPWILMAGPALVIVAGALTAAIAFTGADGLVADDYYKRGLGINRTLAREARARELAIEGTVAIEPRVVRVALTARQALPDRIRLTFAHPTRAGEDRTVYLAREAPGGYSAPLESLPAGRWRLILEAGDWRVGALADTRSPVPVSLTPKLP